MEESSSLSINDKRRLFAIYHWLIVTIYYLFSWWFNGRRGIEVTYDTQEKLSKKYENANRRSWYIKIKVKTTTLDKEVTNH